MKRRFELGRPPASTKIGEKRINTVRCRGGWMKFRALRLDHGNFCWSGEAVARKTRILTVVYNAVSNELVRTNTLVKGAIVEIDSSPFKTWYQKHYGVTVGHAKKDKKGVKKPGTKETKPEDRTEVTASSEKKPETTKPVKKTGKSKTDKPKTDKPKTDKPKTEKPKTDKPKTDKPKTDKPKTDKPKTDKAATDKPGAKHEDKKPSKRLAKLKGKKVQIKEVAPGRALLRKQRLRNKSRFLEASLADQFEKGRLYARITSRPGQCGHADGYILEGEELSFYMKKILTKKKK
jgi:ribosomal protein eS8